MKSKICKTVGIFISVLFILTACGNDTQSKMKENILSSIGYYLDHVQQNHADMMKADSESVEVNLMGYEGDFKQEFSTILELMKQGKNEEVKELYLSIKDKQ